MATVRPFRVGIAVALVVAAFVASPAGALAQAKEPGLIDIPRPGDREFVVDLAEMIRPEDKAKIVEIADKLLKDKATPIVVVTIDSMATHGGSGMRIETFARLLFDQWGIGHAKIDGQDWNTGILLLVSKSDRKARIELGAGWKRDHDAQASQIMDELIIPKFKTGDYSAGILSGVEGLDKMARGLELPRAPTPTWVYIALAVGAGLLIFTVVSLIRRGASGWAWLFWGAVFALLGYLLYTMLQNSRTNSGGGFSGGSFGGGYSGGGGATGSW